MPLALPFGNFPFSGMSKQKRMQSGVSVYRLYEVQKYGHRWHTWPKKKSKFQKNIIVATTTTTATRGRLLGRLVLLFLVLLINLTIMPPPPLFRCFPPLSPMVSHFSPFPPKIQNFLKILLLQHHQQPAVRPAFFNIIMNTTITTTIITLIGYPQQQQ